MAKFTTRVYRRLMYAIVLTCTRMTSHTTSITSLDSCVHILRIQLGATIVMTISTAKIARIVFII